MFSESAIIFPIIKVYHLDCKHLCENACARRLVPAHFTALFCRERKIYLGKLDVEKFFLGKVTVQVEPSAEGTLIPRDCTLYIVLMDNSRPEWVKLLRRMWATIYEFLS